MADWTTATMALVGSDRVAATRHTFPVAYAAEIVSVAERWNVPAVALLSEVGLTPADLEDPTRRLSLEDFATLMESACRVTAEPGFGVYVGLQGRISAHGYLGFAAMTARTLRDAIDLAVHFAPTCTTALALRLEVDGKSAALVVEEVAVFERAREAIIHAAIVGFWRMGNAIVGRELAGGADFAFPEPAFVRRLESVVAAPGLVRYGQPRHRLIFGADQLDLPLVLASAASLSLAREQCEAELSALREKQTLSSRVSARLFDREESVRPVETIARELGLSTRTLKRKLAEEGVSYSSLLDEHRRLRGLELLRSELSLDEIAERLGYSDATNVARAFRRWTGKTPSELRAELRATARGGLR
jgi:AraC-like DNA-binding protein